MKASLSLGAHWYLAAAAAAAANEAEECRSICEGFKGVSARSTCSTFRDVVQRPQLARVLRKCRWGFKAAIDMNCNDACVDGRHIRLYASVERLGEACPGALTAAPQSLLQEACVQGYNAGIEDLRTLVVGRKAEATPVVSLAPTEDAVAPHAANSSEAVEAPKDDDERVMKRYHSFQEFASEQLENKNETLPVPVVISPDRNGSIPLAIIIGVQKGGTQNLRNHLVTHPMLSGMRGDEAHFFDRQWYPTAQNHRGEWPGRDRGGQSLSSYSVGKVLSAYSKKAMESVVPSARNSTATVDSTPVYIFHPLAPYRAKLVLPRARFILILRDPTERYFSQLRMSMCWTKDGETLEQLEKRRNTFFHLPGEAASYFEHGEESYEPYTPSCRGKEATYEGLRSCWNIMQKLNPLHRGLYADQLDRWFRIFDRSQILILEASEMFEDFAGTLEKATSHIGLPAHEFDYDPTFQHESTCDSDRPDLFAAGGRYDRMLEDEQLFREWYRPHNRRLYELLGRTMQWE